MEIREMQIDDIEKRMSEIKEEMNAPEADLDALTAEVDAMEARKAELKEAAEEKRALEKKVADGIVGEVVKDLKEDIEMSEERKFGIDSVEYRNAWLKRLQGKELGVEERSAFSTLAGAEPAVPQEIQDDIITKAKEYAPVLNEITLLNVPGAVKFAVEGTTTAAGTHTELATITAATDEIIEVTLSAYEVTKLIQISASVKSMTMAAFQNWIVEQLAEAISIKIENLIFNGSGLSEAQGIMTVKTTGDETTITAATILSIVGQLKSGYARNAKFAVNRKTFFTAIANLQDKSKNDLVVMDNNVYRLMGIEVMFTDSLADNVVVLGDFKKYVGNFAAPQNIVSGFDIDTNSYKYLGSALFDGKVALAEAFVTIQP